jgi:hypothetical protein
VESRQCIKCRQVKPLGDFHYKTICRVCVDEVYRKYQAPEIQAVSKACTKCGVVKQPTEFSRNAKTRDRLASWCKAGVAGRMKDRRKLPEIKASSCD